MAERKLAESQQLAEETALATIIDNKSGNRRKDAGSQSVDRDQISKIWENDRNAGDQGPSTTLPIKTKSVWTPRPAEKVITTENTVLNWLIFGTKIGSSTKEDNFIGRHLKTSATLNVSNMG
mgnify:CR=1 FL=1